MLRFKREKQQFDILDVNDDVSCITSKARRDTVLLGCLSGAIIAVELKNFKVIGVLDAKIGEINQIEWTKRGDIVSVSDTGLHFLTFDDLTRALTLTKSLSKHPYQFIFEFRVNQYLLL